MNPSLFAPSSRRLLATAAALTLATPAWAQAEKASLKFSQGWLFQATQAQFPLTAEKGWMLASVVLRATAPCQVVRSGLREPRTSAMRPVVCPPAGGQTCAHRVGSVGRPALRRRHTRPVQHD